MINIWGSIQQQHIFRDIRQDDSCWNYGENETQHNVFPSEHRMFLVCSWRSTITLSEGVIVPVVSCVRAKVARYIMKEAVVILLIIASCEVFRSSSHAGRFKHKWNVI